MAVDYSSALYTLVVMAYATLVFAQYRRNGTTDRIRHEKARVDTLWNSDKFKVVRENEDKCEKIRERRDLIKTRKEAMNEQPLHWLFVLILLTSLLLLWNVSIKAMDLSSATTYFGKAVMGFYTAQTFLLGWIGLEIWWHARRAGKLREEVDSWIGLAEASLDIVREFDDEKKKNTPGTSPAV